jgi:hypothetical protein
VAESNANATGRQRFGLLLSGALLLAAGAAACFAVRGSWPISLRSDEAPATAAAVVGEIDIPPGPHREAFQTNCVICHSPLLPLNQPTVTQKQWTEVVHKMVSAYGAPMTPDDESHVVEYLTAVQASR